MPADRTRPLSRIELAAGISLAHVDQSPRSPGAQRHAPSVTNSGSVDAELTGAPRCGRRRGGILSLHEQGVHFALATPARPDFLTRDNRGTRIPPMPPETGANASGYRTIAAGLLIGVMLFLGVVGLAVCA